MTVPVAVVAALNEQTNIAYIVRDAQRAGARCVVSTGDSSDLTTERVQRLGAVIALGEAGRARQLNAGAKAAASQTPTPTWLLFLHADIRLPNNELAADWIERTEQAGAQWARFDVRLVSQGRPVGLVTRCTFPFVATLMNWRSALTGICTGDQGLLVKTSLFNQIGGYPNIALMEDIEICAALKKAAGTPCRLRSNVLVSARRWERDGVFKTMAMMWWYRARFFFGATPEQLNREYYRKH